MFVHAAQENDTNAIILHIVFVSAGCAIKSKRCKHPALHSSSLNESSILASGVPRYSAEPATGLCEGLEHLVASLPHDEVPSRLCLQMLLIGELDRLHRLCGRIIVQPL